MHVDEPIISKARLCLINFMIIDDTDEDCFSPKFARKMNEIAEGIPRDIQPPTDDTTFERKSRDLVKLYQVCDESGSLTITEVGSYPLKRELLDSKVCGCMPIVYLCVCTCMCICVCMCV